MFIRLSVYLALFAGESRWLSGTVIVARGSQLTLYTTSYSLEQEEAGYSRAEFSFECLSKKVSLSILSGLTIQALLYLSYYLFI